MVNTTGRWFAGRMATSYWTYKLMNFPDLKIVLQRLGTDTDLLIETSENQISIPCVLAEWTHAGGSDSHPSLSIRYSDPEQPTLYNCFACHESGTIWQLVDAVADNRDDSELKLLSAQLCESDKPTLVSRFSQLRSQVTEWYSGTSNQETLVVSESVLDKFVPALSHEACKNYLRKRQVPRKSIEDFDIRFDERASRVVFPVRDKQSNLVGAVGRTIRDAHPRYWNYFGFAAGQTLGGVQQATGGTTLIIVEGFFDLLNCYPWLSDINASVVCTWRADVSEDQATMISGLDKSIQFWYDQDTAGHRGYASAMTLLGDDYSIKRARWAETMDVGEMPKQKFVSIFKSLKGELRYGKKKTSR